MELEKVLDVSYGHAICYSGYREGQSPLNNSYPSYQEVVEDLTLLAQHWHYLRIYDCSYHADLVLKAIRNEGFHFKVMLGADLAAEIQSPNCPWIGDHPEQQLRENILANNRQIDRLIELANEYSDSVFSVSVGNEATVEWSDHRVSVERLISFVQRVKKATQQPITFCENYVPWADHLMSLINEIDFISLHTYPVWEYHRIESALDYTKQNFNSVASLYPNKPIIITEGGWPTQSNGRGIEIDNASEELQANYNQQLMDWSRQEKILTFLFEAFDEPWKGSNDLNEPEKHWGVYDKNRQPKRFMKNLNKRLK